MPISDTSKLGSNVTIYHPDQVNLYGCTIGDDVTLFPNVVLYDEVVVGHRVIVHANAVLGADGFGYRLQNGRHVKVPQLGGVGRGAVRPGASRLQGRRT